MCTTLNYAVFTQQDITLDLYPEGPCSSISDTLLLHLSVCQSCPPGFSLDNSSVSCICDQTLQKYTNHCNITNGLGQITHDQLTHFGLGMMNLGDYSYRPSTLPFSLLCLQYSCPLSQQYTVRQTVCIQQVRPLVWSL